MKGMILHRLNEQVGGKGWKYAPKGESILGGSIDASWQTTAVDELYRPPFLGGDMIILSMMLMRLYGLGVIAFTLMGISLVVFKPSVKSAKQAIQGVLLALAWPLALLSRPGRAVLFRALDKYQGGKR